jgi:hypothetical protein
MSHKEQLGFLTVACNTDETDYLQLAYLQALNIKQTQKNNKFAVVVDQKTLSKVTNTHRKVFDYIVESPEHDFGPYGTEAFVFELTPFKETIKLESDLLFTRSIDHWIHSFRLRDVVLSTGCRNYKQQLSDARKYRKTFDDNYLPDVYNGLMYFRFTKTARDFFDIAKKIYSNWGSIINELKNCREPVPSTDIVFALTARIVGEELCTLPTVDFVNFVHMKPAINGFDEGMNFDEVFVTEFDQGMIRINNMNQYHPLHYYNKNFNIDNLIEFYEQQHMG